MKDMIKVYGLEADGWTYKGAFRDYTLFVFKRSYSGIGSFQLFININSPAARFLLEDRVIQYAPKKAGLIEKISLVWNTGDEGAIFSVYGRELKGGISSLRITVPPSGLADETYNNQYTETITKGLLTNHIISPVDTDRTIAHTQNTIDNQLGIQRDFATRYKNLDEELTTLMTSDQLGWYADIADKKVTFEVFEGVDRTAQQSDNSRVVLWLENGMLLGQDYTHSKESWRNYAYTGGQGEGAEREIVEVGTDIGLNRREVFIDARDITETTKLITRGNDKLAEYGDDTVISAEAGRWFLDRYEKSINLGDIVSINLTKPINMSVNARITEVEEVRENNDLKLNITFGYDYNSLKKVLNRKFGANDQVRTI